MGAWLMGSPNKSPALDLISIMGAFIGLMSGGLLVYLRGQKNENSAENNPVLYDIDKSPRISEGFN
jgi:hypothetical protein